jgi:hypothetical protein
MEYQAEGTLVRLAFRRAIVLGGIECDDGIPQRPPVNKNRGR